LNLNVKEVARNIATRTMAQPALVESADDALYTDAKAVKAEAVAPAVFKRRCCEDGTVRLLVKMTNESLDEETRNELCRALLSVTTGFDIGREALIREGGASAICNVLGCAVNKRVVHYLCESLYYLAIEGDTGRGALAAYQAGALPLLQGVIDEGTDLELDTARWCRRAMTMIEKAQD
jgi:hypothetical protein